MDLHGELHSPEMDCYFWVILSYFYLYNTLMHVVSFYTVVLNLNLKNRFILRDSKLGASAEHLNASYMMRRREWGVTWRAIRTAGAEPSLNSVHISRRAVSTGALRAGVNQRR